MNKIFEAFLNKKIVEEGTNTTSIPKEKKSYKFGAGYALLVTLVIGMILEYLILLPLNFKAPQFIMFVIVLLIIFAGLNWLLTNRTNKFSKYTLIVAGIFFAYVIVGNIISSTFFNAKSYQKQLVVNKEADFYKDNKTISYQSIPVVDRDSAIRLGDRKMGEIVEYVSQFEVDESYDQINYGNKPVRVTPLGYSDLIKWFTNRGDGLPAYIKVDMVTQETEVVKLAEGMKYSKSEHFGRNIQRHLRSNYPTFMFEEVAFEVNDEGVPYWVAPVYDYEIGLFGGKDIVGIVLVNAINGEHQYYKNKDIPKWVDRAYPAELVLSQLENWGKFGDGFLNSVFSQKGVLQPTDGYNYIALNDDVYLYTGLTSMSSDASNVGFALINLRTKEAKFYNITGAEEYSAMSSAEGQVQHLGYKATFPILVNVGGEPTYFLSLKDDANLVKKYAFVSVKNYQLVATGDSVAATEKAYYTLLSEHGKLQTEEFEVQKLSGTITNISEAVVDGNSTYYLKVEGSDVVFIASIGISEFLPLAKVGDSVEIEYVSNAAPSEVISTIKFK